LDQCNPALSTLITETLGSRAWLKDLFLLRGLLKHDSDPAFHKKWAAAKANNKERLAAYIKATLGVTIDSKAMFAIQVKRIHVSDYGSSFLRNLKELLLGI
jgi:glycogen phosphorylase